MPFHVTVCYFDASDSQFLFNNIYKETARYVIYIIQICDIYRPDIWHISSRYVTHIVQICDIYCPDIWHISSKYVAYILLTKVRFQVKVQITLTHVLLHVSVLCFVAPHIVTTNHFTLCHSTVCDVIVLSIPFMSRIIMTTVQICYPNLIVQIYKLHCIPMATIRCNTHKHSIVCTKIYLRFAYVCCPDVIHLLHICIYWLCVLHIWTMRIVYLDECYIFEQWVLHIWTTVTYLDDEVYKFGRLLHIWTMGVTYMDERCISGRWRLHIWTPTTRHVTRRYATMN